MEPKNQKSPNSLPGVDRAKVSNIVEVCNVSQEEATRVLLACHMDASLAIDRFLSGKEASTWSEVSKKKKHPATSRTGPAGRHGRGGGSRNHDRDHDHDSDRRARDRPSDGSGNRRNARANGNREHHQSPPQKYGDSANSRPHQHAPKRAADRRDYNRASAAEKDKPSATAYAPVAPAAAPPGQQLVDKQVPAPDKILEQSGPRSADLGWSDTQHDNVPAARRLPWGHDAANTEPAVQPTMPEPNDNIPTNGLKIVASEDKPVTNVPSKRTINYAAAAATGTSHEKRPPQPTAQVSNATITTSAGAPPAVPHADQNLPESDLTARGDGIETKKKRSRGGRKHRGRLEGQRNGQAVDAAASPSLSESTSEALVLTSNGDISSVTAQQQAPSPVAAENPDASTTQRTEPTPTPAVPTNAWAARAAAKEAKDKELDTASVAATPGSAPVVSTPEKKDNSLILQFGSFGFSSLNPAGWDKTVVSQEESIPNIDNSAGAAPSASRIPVVTGPIDSLSAPNPAVVVVASNNAQPPIPSVAVNNDALESAVPKPQIPQTFSAPMSLPSTTGSMANGSIFPPVMPVGVTGAFPPQSYPPPPYIMPPPLPYGSGLNSYDNGSDLNSSRNPNLGPAVPLYDPAALGIPPSSNGAKYNSVPGIGDSSMLPGAGGVNVSAKDMLQGGIGDNDKGNNPNNPGGIPGGIDPLTAQYMMPGYPPYLVPGYASMQYAPPPGMGPSVPSHFPYPPVGQVTSQASFGGYHGQSGNMNKFNNSGNVGRVPFGFDDGSSGISGSNARNSGGLNENIYAQGGYLGAQMPDSMMPKNMADNAAYKNQRGGPGVSAGVANALHGVGVAPGVGPLVSASMPMGVGGAMPQYNDYTANQVHNAAQLNVGNVAAGGWNNRQAGNPRSDGNQGPANNVLAGNAANSGIYAPAPGAPSGYWSGNGYY